jgi:predicted transcriptional regulator of viral defense system
MADRAARPSWDRLYEVAASQEGLFTTEQAAEAGFSTQLLLHHIQRGRAARVRRSIYRLVHFPRGDHEDLVTAWLWSERQGIVSHLTALTLHGLSDALPTLLHLTLPASWSRRRFRVPKGVVLHFDDVVVDDRTWVGPVPTTSVRRTLEDCARANLSPDMLHQAVSQAIHRGLVAAEEMGGVAFALRPFGGLP